MVSVPSFVCVLPGFQPFSVPAESQFSGDLHGNTVLCRLLSAVTFAAYVIFLSRFDTSKISGFLFSFYIALISCVSTLFICLATNSLALPSTAFGWGLCVIFSLLVTTGAVVLFQQSTFLIGGERASILSTLEPITSVIIGVVVFGDPIGIRIVIGSLLVIAASITTALMGMKKKA